MPGLAASIGASQGGRGQSLDLVSAQVLQLLTQRRLSAPACRVQRQTGATHRQAEPAGKPPDFSGRGGQRAPGGAAKRPIPQYPLYLRTPRASAALREKCLGRIIFARLSPNPHVRRIDWASSLLYNHR